MVLLCAAAGEKTVDEFASNEAIQCTEIYEFVQKLGNQEYEMPTLQVGEEEIERPYIIDSQPNSPLSKKCKREGKGEKK